MRYWLIAVVVSLFASVGMAQTQQECGLYDVYKVNLISNGYERYFTGLIEGGGQVFEIWVSPSGVWGGMVIDAETGVACLTPSGPYHEGRRPNA